MKKNISQLLKSLKNFQSALIYKKLNFNLKEWKIHEKKFQINKNLQIILKNKNPIYLIEKLQNLIERSVQNDHEDVILKKSGIWARGITWSLVGGTFFGIAWLALAKTEEIVITQGTLEPINGVVDVKMPIEGIAREIHVKEGEKVKKGDLLITLEPDIMNAKEEALIDKIELSQEIVNRLNNLVTEGAVSELQFLEQKSKLAELKSNLKENQVIKGYQQIKAPINGLIFNLQPKVAGFVARTSEPILKIVPVENLHAKIEIGSQHIGFVSVGKPADISIDSFPASDFGVIKGTVTKIGSDALPPDQRLGKSYRFPGEIKIDSQYLELKNGRKLPLQVGMSLTANIKLRKISYLQLLLGTFQDKTDSLRSL